MKKKYKQFSVVDTAGQRVSCDTTVWIFGLWWYQYTVRVGKNFCCPNIDRQTFLCLFFFGVISTITISEKLQLIADGQLDFAHATYYKPLYLFNQPKLPNIYFWMGWGIKANSSSYQSPSFDLAQLPENLKIRLSTASNQMAAGKLKIET